METEVPVAQTTQPARRRRGTRGRERAGQRKNAVAESQRNTDTKTASAATGAGVTNAAAKQLATASSTEVCCVDFQSLVRTSQEVALRAVVASLPTVGLQATQIGRGRQIVQQALHHRAKGDRVFLAYTSNLISCGLRDTLAYLAREGLVDCFISSAGGVEEDVIKCGGSTLLGQFNLDGRALRRRGINRIGNLLVPNDNYCWFEDFFMPVLRSMHEAQRASRWQMHTRPSDFITAMGAEIEKGHPETCKSSLVYWCYKNNIPFFSPAFTDGSIGGHDLFLQLFAEGTCRKPAEGCASSARPRCGRGRRPEHCDCARRGATKAPPPAHCPDGCGCDGDDRAGGRWMRQLERVGG